MSVFKCKMCGGTLDVKEGMTVCECDYCGSTQTVPQLNNEKKITLFSRANRFRADCEFDKASIIYENILSDFPKEAEAYWGLVLCKYGIEYVDDPATGKKVPTCHRSSFDSILNDHDYEMVLKYADSISKSVYESEAKIIEGLRLDILKISSKEQPYDIFICYKETDDMGKRTMDSVIAQDAYDALSDKGYRVFFSRISLEDKLGQEYEPYIFSALNSAKVMLVFGSSYDYFYAPWVRNEWSRFLQLMKTDRSKMLIPCYKDMDAYDIPKEFGSRQAQDMGKLGAIQDLVRGIGKILPPPKGKQEYQATNVTMPDQPMNDYPEYLERKNRENRIRNVKSIGAKDPNNPFPVGSYSSIMDLEKDFVIFFHLTLRQKYTYETDISINLVVYDFNGNCMFKEQTPIHVMPDYERFSKGWILRGKDGTYVAPGEYTAILWIDDSCAVKYKFTVLPFVDPTEKKYQQAEEAEKTKDYRKAVILFSELGDYKDSRIRAQKNADAFNEDWHKKDMRNKLSAIANEAKSSMYQCQSMQSEIKAMQEEAAMIPTQSNQLNQTILKLQQEINQANGLFSGVKKKKLQSELDAAYSQINALRYRAPELQRNINDTQRRLGQIYQVYMTKKQQYDDLKGRIMQEPWTPKSIEEIVQLR